MKEEIERKSSSQKRSISGFNLFIYLFIYFPKFLHPEIMIALKSFREKEEREVSR